MRLRLAFPAFNMPVAQPTPTRGQLLAIACASRINAQDFARQADALANARSYGRARSLAIIGLEEIGKAFWFWILWSAHGTSTPVTPRRLRHGEKQALSMLGEGYSPIRGSTFALRSP